jgi:ribosomal protein S12 methylthiotransferase accessory factor
VRIELEFPGGRQVTAHLRGHRVATDQPSEAGGSDSAPSPFELFFVSLATCAGYYALRFCESREIAREGLAVDLVVERAPGHGPITAVRVEVTLPEGFPDRYREPLLRAVDQCAVKKFIADPPPIEVNLIESPVSASAPN